MSHLWELAFWCFALSWCVVCLVWGFVKSDLLKASILKAADQFGDWADEHGHVGNPLFDQTMRKAATIANFSPNFNASFFWMLMRRGMLEVESKADALKTGTGGELEQKANQLMVDISGKIMTHVFLFTLPGVLLLPVLASHVLYLKWTGRKWSGFSAGQIPNMIEKLNPISFAG